MCVGAAALGLLGFAGALPMKAAAADVVFLGHRVSWLVPVLGLSLVAAVIAYVAGIGAARRLGAKLASFIGMTEVLFAILFAWLALGQLVARPVPGRRLHPGRDRAGARRGAGFRPARR